MKLATEIPVYERLTHAEYRELSARTVSPNFWINKEIHLVCHHGRIQELHMSVGLVTEIQEIMLAIQKPSSEERRVNIGEEIADAWWYVAGLERLYGMDLTNVQTHLSVHTHMTLVCDLFKDSIDILDVYKKQLFYNAPLNDKVYSILKNIANTLETLAIDNGFDTAVLKAKNINKLVARFPVKFTEIDAQVRDLKKEYETLK